MERKAHQNNSTRTLYKQQFLRRWVRTCSSCRGPPRYVHLSAGAIKLYKMAGADETAKFVYQRRKQFLAWGAGTRHKSTREVTGQVLRRLLHNSLNHSREFSLCVATWKLENEPPQGGKINLLPFLPAQLLGFSTFSSWDRVSKKIGIAPLFLAAWPQTA